MNKKNVTTLSVLGSIALVLSLLIKMQGLDQDPKPKKPDPNWLTRNSSATPEFRFFMVAYSSLIADFATKGIKFYEDVSDEFKQDGRTLYVTPDPKWQEGTFPVAVIHKLWANANGGDKDVTVCVLDADGEIVEER